MKMNNLQRPRLLSKRSKNSLVSFVDPKKLKPRDKHGRNLV